MPRARLGNVGGGRSRIAEDVIFEQLAPELLLVVRQVADREDGVIESVLRLRKEPRRLAPPVIHQHVERLERLDVVPPHGRDEQSVARLQLGDLRDL